jgi:hypothetical protein
MAATRLLEPTGVVSSTLYLAAPGVEGTRRCWNFIQFAHGMQRKTQGFVRCAEGFGQKAGANSAN